MPYGVPYWAESSPGDLEEEESERARSRAKLGLYAHAGTYALVIALLAVLNLSQAPDRLWFVWPMFGWGLAVLIHALTIHALCRVGGAASRYFLGRELRRI